MNTENGRKSAWGKSFLISTQQASKVLRETTIGSAGKALDLGCGNFRNASYLAMHGYQVDAFDIADLHSHLDEIDPTVKALINYKIIDLNEYHISEDYDIILACRLFQYLSPEKVESIIDEAYNHLSTSGKFLISINTGGGIFNRNEINVPKYQHDIEHILLLLEKNGFTTKIMTGSPINTDVNYIENINSYDIEAIKNEKFISTK